MRENTLRTGLNHQAVMEIQIKLCILTIFFVCCCNALIEVNYDFEGGKHLLPGKALVIQCNTTENPGFSIKWFKDNQDIIPNDHLKLIDMNHTLRIDRPNENDAGIYVCQADFSLVSNAIHSEMNKTVVVHMDPLVEPFDTSKNLVEGENLKLECKVHGYPEPEVSWFIGNVPIEKIENASRITVRHEPEIKSSFLEIENVNLDDRNSYRCLAVGNFNSSESTILVRVKARRHRKLWIVNSDGTAINIRAGERVAAICNLTSRGLGNIQWLKGGVDINTSKRVKYSSDMKMLFIENSTNEDSGLYQCIPTRKTESRVSTSGSRVTRHTDKTGKEVHDQIPGVKDAPSLGQTRALNVTQNITSNQSSVANVTQTQSAHNASVPDDDSLAVNLTVIESHYDMGSHTKVRVEEGDSLVLKCEVNSTQDVKSIKWFKGKELLSNSLSKVKIYSERNKTEIKFLDMSLEDDGVYSCLATTESDKKDATIRVRVLDNTAALYPFVGILIEVAILCFIILYWEKRNRKRRRVSKYGGKKEDKRKKNDLNKAKSSQTSRLETIKE